MPATPRGKKSSTDSSAQSNTNVKVMTRCRLFNAKELKASRDRGEDLLPVVRMRPNGDVELHELYKVEGSMMSSRVLETFSFDHAFWSMPSAQAECPGCPYATQQDVFEQSGAVATQAAFEGFNSCIFAYGQTGSGKTYTMLGSDADPGVCPRVVDDVFARMDKIAQVDAVEAEAFALANGDIDAAAAIPDHLTLNKCELELTFYEIYMEEVRDLFNTKSTLGEYSKPKIAQGPFGVTVNGLNRKKPKDGKEAKKWMIKAMEERTTAPTKMNPFSSRSHAVFQLHLTQVDGETGTRKRSTINLVDLAGSEKLKQSEAEGFTAKQAIMINKSLFCLRSVIDAIVAKAKHIPLRESILTFTLSDALGGNSKTQMIAAVSPHVSNLEDSKHTLQYAMKAKKMVTKPTINQENSEVARLQQAKLIEELKRQLAEGAVRNATLPEGVVPMTPQEVKEQIAEQEAKLQEFVTETAELKEEFEKKEEAHKEIVQAKQRLLEQAQVDAKLRRQEQFKRAFQNAFKISREKDKVASLRKELHHVQEEKRELNRQQAEAEAKQHEAESRTAALRGAIGVMETQFQDQKKKEERTREAHAREMSQVREDNAALQATAALREEKVASLEHQVAKLTALLEIGTEEKSRLKQDWEKEALKHDRKADTLRNARDLFKTKAELEETRASEMRTVFDSQREDHKTMLQTIAAQHRMIQQQQEAALAMQDNKRKQTFSAEQDTEALQYYKQLAADQQKELAALTAQLTHLEMQNFDLMQKHLHNNNNHDNNNNWNGASFDSQQQEYRRSTSNYSKSPSTFHRQDDSARSSLSPRLSGGGARGKSPSLGRRGASPPRVTQYQDPAAEGGAAQSRWKA